MHDFRTCKRCSCNYVMGVEGGTKYCHSCTRDAKLEQMRAWRAGRALEKEELADRRYEYFWPYACSTCGMKYVNRNLAESCCSLAWDGLNPKPIHLDGGCFWMHLMDCKRDSRLELELMMIPNLVVPMDSKSQDTSWEAS